MSNKIYKTLDGRDIVHRHINRRSETEFTPCDSNGDVPFNTFVPIIRKLNCEISWDNPLSSGELDFISQPFS